MKSITVLVAIFAGVCLIPNTSAQGMNLLRNYFRQYFSNFQPSTIRSYTLYGNGQNQPADYQAGLPYPYDHRGKVSRLIYPSTSKVAQKKLLYDQSEVDISNARPVDNLHNTEEFVNLHPSQLSQIPQAMYRTDLQAQKRSDDLLPVPVKNLGFVQTTSDINHDTKPKKSFIPFDKFENNLPATGNEKDLSIKSTKEN